MDLRLGLIIFTFYCVTTVTPAKLPITKSGNQCSLHCTESKNLLYQPGKTYIYDYDGKTQISSAEGNGQVIEVKAKAHVSVIDNCELSLQLKNVQLKGLESENEAIKELQDRPIGFSYQDGSVASVCPSAEDSTWSVNVKKAIISALQVSSTPKSGKTIVTEIDILGHCETQYEAIAIPSSSNTLKSIKKTKNLRNCHHRQANLFSLFPTKYSSESNGIQNIPILANEHSCSIEVSKESIVSRVICTDSATLLPLSWSKSASSGFDSMLTLTLEASVPSSSVRPIDSSKRQTLAFKHTLKESWASAKSDANQVINLLKDLCSSIEDEVKSNVPSRFAELVYHLRSLSPSSTSKIWSAISKNEICPSTSKLSDLFTDALIMDGSEGSLKVIVELINEGTSSPLTVNYWLTLLAFASSPTEGSIKSLLPLIKNKALPRQSVLGVSALVHNYCSSPDVDCTSSPIVNEVTRTLASRLAYKCSVSPDTEDDAIVALKGLANVAPYLSTGEIRSILECSKDSNSLFVRITAIETLQSVSCLDSVAPTMMELFISPELDAELRIAAYKNVISCPSASKIEAIITTLENENSTQVGSYVVSHLCNIQESSDPLKSEIKLYLTGIKIPLKSFPQDIRKYSRYYELSQHFSKINVGAVVESDVIFDGSYIPRSIKANLSVPIFGSSINFAEVGFRQKGLENSIQSLFGPSGSLKDKNWREILETLATALLNENDPNEIEANRYRLARRSVQWPFKPVKLESLVKKATITPAPVEGSMYLKVDGKTIIYLSVADAKKDSIKSIFDSRLENVVKSAKYDRAFSFMVMDSIHQFPGINGFPIKIDINSTAVVGYKQTDETIYPSLASQLSVKIGFDARTSQPGLKWVTTVNSAPALSAQVKYKNSIPVNVTLSIPKETLTLFHYKSELISIAADNSEKQIRSANSRHHDGCTQSFTKSLGFELCGEFTAPKPLFTLNSPFIPFNGPMNFDISLRKTDKSMKGWTFFMEIPDDHEIEHRVYKIGFDKPGSMVNSEYKLSLGFINKINSKSNYRNVQFSLNSPFKSIDALVSSEFGDKIVQVRGGLVVDFEKSYTVMARLTNQQPGKDMVYEGEILLGLDHLIGRTINIKSKMSIKEDNSINFVVKPDNGVSYIEGAVSLTQPRVDIFGDLRFISFKMSSSMSREKSGLKNNFNLSYRKPNSNKEEKLTLSSSFKQSLTGSIHKYISKVEGSASKWPKNSFLVTWESSYAPWELVENDLTIETGYKSSRGYSSKSKVTQVSRFTGLTGDYSDVFARNTLVIDVAGVYYKANFMANGQLTSSSPRAKIDFTGGNRSNGDKHKVLIDFGAETKPLFRSTSSAIIRLGSVSVNFADSLSEKSQGQFVGNNELMISGSTFWTVGYNYSKGNDNQYKMTRGLDMSIKLPSYNIDFTQDGSFVMENDQIIVTTMGSNRQSKLWSIDSKISQSSNSSVKIDLHSIGSAELEVSPFAPTRLGYLKLSRNGYTKLSKFAYSPSSIGIDSELKSKSSLIYQLAGRYKSINKWSTSIITKSVILSVALAPQNGKFDLKLTKPQVHHITSFSKDQATFSFTTETKQQSKPILSMKTDYHSAGTLAVEFVSNPVELHSEATFKSIDRLELESNLNLKKYGKFFTIEASRVKKNVKINLTGRDIFSVKCNIDSTENFKLDIDITDQGTTGLEISNKPDLKAFALNGNYPSSGWEQSTLIQHTSEATTIFSNTQKLSQRYFFINGRLAESLSALDVKLGESESLYSEWSSVKGKGSLKLTSGQYSFDHDSSLSLVSNKVIFSSLTSKSSKSLIKVNFDSDLSSKLDLIMSLNDDHSLSLALDSKSNSQNANLKLTSKSQSLDHFTKVNYAPSADSFDLKSSTTSKGIDVATIKFQSTARAPVTIEIYSLKVIGTFQVESSGGDKRYALKVVHPINLETEINNKQRSSQFNVYSVYKHLNGQPIYEIDAKIQPKGLSTIDVNIEKMKGHLTYSYWSSIGVTFDSGSGFDHQTTINLDTKTSILEIKSSSTKSGSAIVHIDGYFDINERMSLKVVNGPWDGAIEMNVANSVFTTSLNNQVKALIHSTRATLKEDLFTLTSNTMKSSVDLFSLDCQLSVNSKSEIKLSTPTWSSTSTYNVIKSSSNFQFTLNRPSISSEYIATVIYDSQASSLKLTSNIQRKTLKSSIDCELNGSAKSWFKYSSSSNGRIDCEVNPFGTIKTAKISIDWKPTQFIHNSEIKNDQFGLKVKSTSSRFSNSIYTFNGEIGFINEQSPGIELNLVTGASSYRHASSYSLTENSANLQSKSIVNRVTLWDIKGNLPFKPDQLLTTFNLDSPRVSGKIIFDPIDRSIKIETLVKQSKQKIVLKTVYGPMVVDSFTFDLSWDADKDPNARLLISRDGETNDSSRKDSFTMEYGSNVKAKLSSKINYNLLTGPHDVSLAFNLPNSPSKSISLVHEMTPSEIKCAFRFYENNQVVHQLVHEMHMGSGSVTMEIGTKSSYPTFDGLHLSFKHSQNAFSSITSELKIQPSSGSPYSVKLNTESPVSRKEKSYIGKLLVKTPINQYRQQGITINLSWTPEGTQSSANLKITRESGDSASFSSSYSMKSSGGSLSLSLDGPLSGVFDGSKVKGQFDSRSNKKSVTFDSDIITIGSFNVILSEQRGKVEGQVTLSSPRTSRYIGTLKTNMKTFMGITHEVSLTQDNLELFASKLTLDYGKPLLGQLIVSSKGSDVLRFGLNRFDVSSEEIKYIADYTGPKGPLKVNLNLQSTTTLSQIELQVCPASQCYSLQATDIINQWGRDSKITYRNGAHSRVYAGSYIFKSKSGDFTASGLLNLNGVPFGAELLTTSSKSIGKIILAQRIIEARIKSTDSKFVIDFMADAKREPSSKVTIEADWINQSIPSKGIINVNYKLRFGSSSLYRPISVSFLFKKDPTDGQKPFDSRIILDLGKSDSQSLIIESYLENISSNNKSIALTIYQPGSSSKVNFALKGHLGYTKTRSSAGINWSWIDDNLVNRRGFNLFNIDLEAKEMTYIAHGGFNDISSRIQYLTDDKSSNLIGEMTINGKTKKGQLTSELEGNCGSVKVFCNNNLKRKIEACYEPYQSVKINSQRFNYDSSAQTDLSLMLSQRNGKVLKASMNLDPNYSKQLKSIDWPSTNLRKPQWKGIPSTLLVDSQIFVDIYDPISKSITVESIELVSEINQHTLPLRRVVGDYAPKLSFNIPKIDISSMFDRLINKIDTTIDLNSMKDFALDVFSSCKSRVDDMTEILSENWPKIKASISKWTNDLITGISQSIKSNLFESQYFPMMSKKLNQLAKLPCKLAKSVSVRMSNVYTSLKNRIMSNPDIKSLVDIITGLYVEILTELRKGDYTSALKSSASQYRYLASPDVWGASARFTTWNPAKGMYEAEIVSPVDVGTVKSSIRSSQQSLSDLNDSLNGLKASLWSEMAPPFKATAFLLGGQHFITFDGKSFDLNSVDCSYLLARDFINGSFSVIVKYLGENKKSFLVTLGDESVIEIIPSEKRVKLGKNNVELPVVQGSLTILRHHQSIVLQDSSTGLTFKCFLGHDLCSLSLSGWYFGRTKGLFGTYDYEPSNDYLLPNGKQATDVSNFASGWEIEGSCANPSGTPVRRDEIRRSSKAYRLCSKTFTSSESPLADGFSFVPPSFYFEMCLRHMASTKGQERPEKALCTVAGAYIESVRANGFELTMPSECLTCEAGQEFGSRTYISPTIKSSRADVVFVIEERPCNTKLINDLPNLARSMNKELEEIGLRDPRFGVIGFGGLSREAHGHTARGELLFKHQDTMMATKRMELAPANSYDANYTDALSAIVLASQYPFRKAASKNIVLLTCKPCDEKSSRFDYNDIQHLLLSEGITLHVVSNQRFESKHATSKTREIFGIDSGSIQRASDIRSTEISDEQIYLRKSITIPKDICISLAHISNGAFYPSPLAISLEQRLEKLWSLGLVRRVASTAIPNQCQHCDCVPDNDLLHSKILCRPCRPLKPVH